MGDKMTIYPEGWALIFVVLLDTITTIILNQHGFTEANPLLANYGDLNSVLIIKVCFSFLIILFICWVGDKEKKEELIRKSLKFGTGAYIIIWCMLFFFFLLGYGAVG